MRGNSRSGHGGVNKKRDRKVMCGGRVRKLGTVLHVEIFGNEADHVRKLWKVFYFIFVLVFLSLGWDLGGCCLSPLCLFD